uniref:Uncharacterized protein n=1 Tax=Acrobeloides nanus TaxID=290746 RepID=A0A914E2J0_9BILA
MAEGLSRGVPVGMWPNKSNGVKSRRPFQFSFRIPAPMAWCIDEAFWSWNQSQKKKAGLGAEKETRTFESGRNGQPRLKQPVERQKSQKRVSFHVVDSCCLKHISRSISGVASVIFSPFHVGLF